MAEIDPLIFRLISDTRAARADVKRFQRETRQGFGRVQSDVRQLESQIKRSSGEIGVSLKGLAATLAATFSVRQIQQFADGYTRFQNSLKVTGLEGERLGAVQERLFDIAQKYGTELESIGSLYGRTAQSQDELGASSQDLIAVSEAVSASLKILPADAGAVQGALTQLGQAFASPRVQAEEFNSIVDVLTPLMQEVAKHIEGTGGTLAGLKQKLKDLKGEGVSNVELFRAIAASLAELQEKAAKADQTIGQSLTKLNNALGVYIGQTDDGLSATERMAGAIETLAENIDLVANTLAVLTVFMGGRFVAGLVVARGALAGTAAQMGLVGAASFALQARAAGAATSLQALGFAARGFAATGIGLVVTAAAVGIGYLATENQRAKAAAGQLSASIAAQASEFETLIQKQREADASIGALDASQNRALTSTANLTGEAGLLANAWARVAAAAKSAAIEQARASREQALTNLRGAQAAFSSREDVEFRRRAKRPFAERGLGRDAPAVNAQEALAATDRALVGSKEYSDLVQATATLRALNRRVENLKNQSLQEFRAPASIAPASDGKSRAKGGGASSSGPSAAEIEQRFTQEFDSISQQILSARQSTAATAQQRAELERQSVDLAEKAALESLAADGDYLDSQKKLLAAQLEKLGDAERERIAFNERAQIEQEAADRLYERFQGEQDALRLQYDLADTSKERLAIAMRILDAEDAYLREKLQSVVDANTINGIQNQQAKLAQLQLDALNATAGDRRAVVAQQNEGALARYGRYAKDFDARIEEITADRIRDINETITDTLADELGIDDPFLKGLLAAFLDRNIFGPLADSLSGGGGGDFLGGLIRVVGSLLGGGGSKAPINLLAGTPFGRASGGSVSAGQVYRVNEGASPGRVEAFQPNVSGQIIPLGRMDAIRGGTSGPSGTVRVIVEEAPGFAARVRTEAVGVAVEVTRASAPGIVDAAVSETFRQSNRGRI